jgi:glycosyltransferase involved in cell wall biosynthesis
VSTDPTLSVVVCTYNGAARLVPCLEALSHQLTPVDVLVVDDGSTDGTAALARGFGFTVIQHEHNQGVSVARNTGLTGATSSIVAYCDDDCTPPADWTDQILAAWNEHPEATVIGGMIEVDHPVSFTQRYLVYRNPLVPVEQEIAHDPSFLYRVGRQFRAPRFPTVGAFPVYSVVGANMSMNRARAIEAGGFDESLVFGEGEEVALCVAARALFGDEAVIVDPRVVLSHRFDPSILKTWRRSFVYGRGAGERWRKSNGWPSLPVVGPTAVIAAVVVGSFSWFFGAIVGVAALATPWAFWISRTSEKRRAGMMAYPFASLVDDLASVVGFAQGVRREAGGLSKVRRP